MPSTLTVSELQYAKSLIGSSTESASEFYKHMSNAGYGYADIAKSVITCTGMGAASQEYLAKRAAEQGVPLTNKTTTDIATGMANGYIDALIKAAEANGGAINRDVTFEEARSYHDDVFAKQGLGPQTWSMDLPSQLLDPEEMQRDWENSIDKNATFGVGGLRNRSLPPLDKRGVLMRV